MCWFASSAFAAGSENAYLPGKSCFCQRLYKNKTGELKKTKWFLFRLLCAERRLRVDAAYNKDGDLGDGHVRNIGADQMPLNVSLAIAEKGYAGHQVSQCLN